MAAPCPADRDQDDLRRRAVAHELRHDQGLPIEAIQERVGRSARTVYRYLALPEPQLCPRCWGFHVPEAAEPA